MPTRSDTRFPRWISAVIPFDDAEPGVGRVGRPRRQCDCGLLESARGHLRPRSWTAGCTPATWFASTTRAGCISSIGSRTSSTGAARTCPASRSKAALLVGPRRRGRLRAGGARRGHGREGRSGAVRRETSTSVPCSNIAARSSPTSRFRNTSPSPPARCRATPAANCSRASCANRCGGVTRCDEPTLLIANRGEIALRIIRTATELGMQTVAVYAEDDADSPHVHAADEAIGLPGAGPDAYLDQAAMLAAAKTSGAEMIHPGYGFLSENAEFARCLRGRRLHVRRARTPTCWSGSATSPRPVPPPSPPVCRCCPATEGPSSVEDVRAFFAAHDGAIMIKALAGGGGRGMRKVERADQIDDAYRQCAAEAQLGFGNPALFAEAATRRRAAHRGADRRRTGRAPNACARPR